MHPFFKPLMGTKGFSLSELMVSLTVVGVVASLTVPVIINNVQEARNKALLKQSISTISQAWMQAVTGGELWANTAWGAMQTPIYSKLYAAKTCAQGITGGCVGRLESSTPDVTAIKLPNGVGVLIWGFGNQDQLAKMSPANGVGVLIWGFGNCGPAQQVPVVGAYNACHLAHIYLDVNGSLPPNQANKDIMMLIANRTDTEVPTLYGIAGGATSLKPYQLVGNGAYGQLYPSLFQ